MKVKSITISRDSICSRLPGIIPSLVDSWSLPDININCGTEINEGKMYTYSSAVSKAAEYGLSTSLLDYECNFEYLDNNYGLVVSDIIIPDFINVTDYTDFYVNIPKPNNDAEFYDLNDKNSFVHYEGRKIISGYTEVKVLTYASLIKWYNFFKKYYKTKGKYPTAKKCYESTYETKNYTDERKYSEMDELFESRGGDTMYNWIEDNCLLNFEIPSEYADEWKASKLCYSDALKWQKWFSDRVDKYNKKCEITDNCCECDEFKRLGGEKFLQILNAWIENAKKKFENFKYSLNSASYVIPIVITTNIDDLGEMSIFSSDWEAGVDYHNTIENEKDVFFNEANGGTVVNRPYYKDEYGNVVYDYSTYIIKNSETKGYKYNKFYENEFFYRDWYDYTDFYIRNHPEEFTTNGVVTYAYSKLNNKVIHNPLYDSVKNVYYENEEISYVKQESVLINNLLIKIIDGEYVIPNYNNNKGVANLSLKTNKILPVINDGILKYVELNDKKYYVKKDGNKEKVYFLKDSNCYDYGVEVLKGKYIIYNNNVFLVNNGKITLEDFGINHYTLIDGYFQYYGQTFYIIGDVVVVEKVTDDEKNVYFDYVPLTYNDLEELKLVNILVSGDKVIISHKLDESYSNKITGYSDSKLDLLRRRKINTDELGNELPGYFDLDALSTPELYKLYDEPCNCDENGKTVQFGVDTSLFLYGSHYNTPYSECTLDLLYKVGEVSELKKFTTVSDDGETYVDYFVGNYLESIEFYYMDEDGKHINSVFVEGEDSRPYLKMFDKDGEKYIEDEILYCNITYYLDATLKDTGEKYILDDFDNSYIKYVDTVMVNKEVGNFYMGDGSYFTFKYYFLTPSQESKNIKDFNDVKNINVSKFEITPALYVPKDDLSLMAIASSTNDFDGSCLEQADLSINVDEIKTVEEESYWEKNNGMAVFPVFRQEYNLGTSLPQNIDTNIYIDRGINAAFENHLKIMESHTLEALENYGNGYFKINNY